MNDERDFDVALSFSGDHRTYVAEVAAGLRGRGLRVFYDQYLRPELLGQELLAYLQDVYSHRSNAVVAFISEQWVTRPWPTHERESALSHALLAVNRVAPFLLPFRFDDTPVPGFQATVAYEDLRTINPGERRWRTDNRFRHPRHTVDLIADALAVRGISSDATADEFADESSVRVRLVWIDGGAGLNAVGGVPLDELEDGVTEVFADEVEPGGPTAGRYKLVREELGGAVNPNEPVPVFLHESFRAYEKSWIQRFGDDEDEIAVADNVKRQVQNSVEYEISGGAVPIGPTLTVGITTHQGPAVYGMCVMARADNIGENSLGGRTWTPPPEQDIATALGGACNSSSVVARHVAERDSVE